jgi:hypothetical protein
MVPIRRWFEDGTSQILIDSKIHIFTDEGFISNLVVHGLVASHVMQMFEFDFVGEICQINWDLVRQDTMGFASLLREQNSSRETRDIFYGFVCNLRSRAGALSLSCESHRVLWRSIDESLFEEFVDFTPVRTPLSHQ